MSLLDMSQSNHCSSAPGPKANPSATYRQPCDSYFVETQDDVERRYRDGIREQRRRVNRQRQLHIAESLSATTSAEYRLDVIEHTERMELETLPDVASIDIQTEIQWFMRPYLLDFLIEAHTAFGLLEETLFLTVNLLDRYCSKRIVYKNHYQLVGCAALLIAAKYGDRKERVPTIKELRVMCCNLYDDDMFTQMEWHVLQTLQWVIGHPTVDSFHQLALETFPYDAEVEHLATYLSEIAMFEREFVSKRPSDVARASLALARAILPNRSQPLHADWASKYDTDTLVCLSRVMHKPTPVLSRKYATMEKARVSIILEDFLEKQAAIARYQATAPPTPPCEVNPSSNVGRTQYAGPYTTPTKTHLPVLPTGCLTPPITPTNPESATQYHQHPSYTVGPARPLTPQSATMKSAPQYSYGLPPVSMMTSGY